MHEHTPHVLIVDDEPDVRELLGDIVRREGCTFETAATGAEACAIADDRHPDLLIADLRLPDDSGVEVINRIHDNIGSIPTLVITGSQDMKLASEAWRHGCVDFLTKPLDLDRIREAVRQEITRARGSRRQNLRSQRLQRLAHESNRRRKLIKNQLNTTCAALSDAYRQLTTQFTLQEAMIRFQRQLLTCQDDDDIFRNLFGFLGDRCEELFGVAMACDEHAEMQMIGRFGTPLPDSISVCQSIALSLLDVVLEDPVVTRLSGQTHRNLFPEWLLEYVEGVNFLVMPLLPEQGQLIGLVILYRKTEKTFSDADVELAEMLAPAIASAIQGRAGEAAA